MESNHPTGGLLRPAGFEDQSGGHAEGGPVQGGALAGGSRAIVVRLSCRRFGSSREASTRARLSGDGLTADWPGLAGLAVTHKVSEAPFVSPADEVARQRHELRRRSVNSAACQELH